MIRCVDQIIGSFQHSLIRRIGGPPPPTLMTGFHPSLTSENEREERKNPQTVEWAIRRTGVDESGNQNLMKALALVPLELRMVNATGSDGGRLEEVRQVAFAFVDQPASGPAALRLKELG